jgi:hypothetical protein
MAELKYSSTILYLGIRRSVSLPWNFTPGEVSPGTHCIGGWVSPRAGLDAVKKKENSCSARNRTSPATVLCEVSQDDQFSEHYPLPNFYFKRRFGDSISPPSLGEKPTHRGQIDWDIPCFWGQGLVLSIVFNRIVILSESGNTVQ